MSDKACMWSCLVLAALNVVVVFWCMANEMPVLAAVNAAVFVLNCWNVFAFSRLAKMT